MRIFVLGGYGKTGIAITKLLSESDLVSEITVAGRNLERAEEVAKEMGEKVTAALADGTDEEKMTSLLAGYDFIVNAATNDAVLPCIRAAIHNGAHYCDMAWAGVLEQARQLDSEARAAQITAVIATGISPCISNLIGVHAARGLDEVEQLQIGRADIFWNFQSGNELSPRQWRQGPKESLVALQEFKSFLEWMLKRVQDDGIRTVVVYQDGGWVEIDPLKNGLDVPTLGGGRTRSHPFMSGNDFWGSLPTDLSNVSPVEMAFSSFPPQLGAVLQGLALDVQAGELDAETAINTFYDTFERDPDQWLTVSDDYTAPAKLWVNALGRKNGRAACCSCWFTAPMWEVNGWYLTSVALVAAVLKILRGEMKAHGVMTAEKGFEPLSFLAEVASLIPEYIPDQKLIGESFAWLD